VASQETAVQEASKCFCGMSNLQTHNYSVTMGQALISSPNNEYVHKVLMRTHCGVGQNRIYTPYMNVCMVISLVKVLHVHRIYIQIYGSGPPYTFVVCARRRSVIQRMSKARVVDIHTRKTYIHNARRAKLGCAVNELNCLKVFPSFLFAFCVLAKAKGTCIRRLL
jgi:hypothetical protein